MSFSVVLSQWKTILDGLTVLFVHLCAGSGLVFRFDKCCFCATEASNAFSWESNLLEPILTFKTTLLQDLPEQIYSCINVSMCLSAYIYLVFLKKHQDPKVWIREWNTPLKQDFFPWSQSDVFMCLNWCCSAKTKRPSEVSVNILSVRSLTADKSTALSHIYQRTVFCSVYWLSQGALSVWISRASIHHIYSIHSPSRARTQSLTCRPYWLGGGSHKVSGDGSVRWAARPCRWWFSCLDVWALWAGDR